MLILEDSRQQEGKHELKHKWWLDNGHQLYRSKLAFGDYALPPKVAIDTKMNMAEIANNIGGSKKEHERFRRELILAKECGSKLYILVENTDGIKQLSDVQYWENPRLKKEPRAITGLRLCKAMDTMQNKYGVRFMFCHPSQSARIITQLLERENER